MLKKIKNLALIVASILAIQGCSRKIELPEPRLDLSRPIHEHIVENNRYYVAYDVFTGNKLTFRDCGRDSKLDFVKLESKSGQTIWHSCGKYNSRFEIMFGEVEAIRLLRNQISGYEVLTNNPGWGI
ncbi:hypothetical protein FJZ17_00600 [Candidatus Pacearchaeota archaeon]|nr:hypothetical protein [Candidatus Pacearchaeota archaeon]